MAILDGVGKVVVAAHTGSLGAHSVFAPGVTVAVFVTSPPGQLLLTVAWTVNVTVPPGARTTGTPMNGPVPFALGPPATVDPSDACAVQVRPSSGGVCGRSVTAPSPSVALVLVTVTVYVTGWPWTGVGASGESALLMVRVAMSGVEVSSSVASQVGRPSAHSVPAPGSTWPTLTTWTGTVLCRIVAMMVKVTVPPLETTVNGTSTGDPVPLAGGPHDPASEATHDQEALAVSSSAGSGSEKVATPVAPLLGLVIVTVHVPCGPGTGGGSFGAWVLLATSRAGTWKESSATQVGRPSAHE